MIEAVTFPDIERAACTMLAQSRVFNPVLREWRRLIVADPGYMEYLETVDISAEESRYLRGISWITGENAFDAISFLQPITVGMDSLAVVLRERYEGWSDASILRDLSILYMDWLRDRAALYLAWGIVSFRRSGRPPGDVTVDLGYGGIVVSTSLAAVVAKFALDMSALGSWHVHQDDVRYMTGLSHPSKE